MCLVRLVLQRGIFVRRHFAPAESHSTKKVGGLGFQVVRCRGEKVLILYKRSGHTCPKVPTFQVVGIVVNEAIDVITADLALKLCVRKVPGRGKKSTVIKIRSQTSN